MPRHAILIFSALLALPSCQKETAVEKATREKILLVGNSTDPKSLDPHLVTGVIESNVIRSLLEGLVADDPKSDTAYPPGAATHWEHNSNYTEWTFHLRPDGKWSDGESLTAEDFVFAYNRLLHPDLAGPYADMLYFIRNAAEYNQGKITDFSQVGVRAVDNFTLHITLREPVPFLPDITRHYTWFPVPRHAILKAGKISDRFTSWCEPGNYVGNGPFVLKSWRFNDRIEVVRNPHYWNVANVKLNGVHFIPVENFFSEARGFLAGQLHTTYQLPPTLVDKIRAEYPQYLRQEPYIATDFVRVNTTRKGLDDPRVRLALSLAINREDLCTHLLQGNKPASSFTPHMGDYHPEAVVAFNPERAKALMAEAGYPNGRGFPEYKILISTSGNRGTVEAVQAMWKEHLGVRVDVRSMDFASYISAQQRLDYDLSLSAWTGDYLDPSTFLLMWTEGNGNNNTGWSSKAYEDLLNQAAHQEDPAQRLEHFKRAEKILMEEQPVLPFSWRARNYLLRPEVKNWHPLLLDNHPWGSLDVEPQ